MYRFGNPDGTGSSRRAHGALASGAEPNHTHELFLGAPLSRSAWELEPATECGGHTKQRCQCGEALSVVCVCALCGML